MIKRKRIFFSVITLLAVARLQTAHAAEYEIIFEEGAFTYKQESMQMDVDNKYLARVTVIKDGTVVAKNLRGSTLPDAWVFYHRWHVELNHTGTPGDDEIVSIFYDFEKRTQALRDSNVKLGETSLADLAEIIDVLNRVPVIRSGDYPFVMGLHKGGMSYHGKPYVPRLLGGTHESPYDSSDPSSKATFKGGYIRTLNKNNAQNQEKIADGINIHDGRYTKDYKDSEGCLTIHPKDWEKFYRALPTPEDWQNNQHEGVVKVKRHVMPETDIAPPNPPMSITKSS